jgi:hypothetical protein
MMMLISAKSFRSSLYVKMTAPLSDPVSGDGYFVIGSVNPNARSVRTRRASGRPMTV